MNVNTVNDWINEVAAALRDGDQDTLNELDNISYGWLQGSDERGAQQNLIEACYEALEV
tara:strand:+ start:578 stop:754 length:177 start_codon:yes stop_codon:yes gene_type:complete